MKGMQMMSVKMAALIVKPNKAHMQEALQSIATNPKPQRGGGSLRDGSQKHKGSHQNESQVPYQIKNHEWPRV